MNKEENFINTLFEKTEESEAVKPQTTEIIKMPMSSIVPNFKNPYKCREEDMKPFWRCEWLLHGRQSPCRPMS